MQRKFSHKRPKRQKERNMDKICAPPDSLFHLTFCNNVMSLDQTIDTYTKFRFSLIIADPIFTKLEVES